MQKGSASTNSQISVSPTPSIQGQLSQLSQSADSSAVCLHIGMKPWASAMQGLSVTHSGSSCCGAASSFCFSLIGEAVQGSACQQPASPVGSDSAAKESGVLSLLCCGPTALGCACTVPRQGFSSAARKGFAGCFQMTTLLGTTHGGMISAVDSHIFIMLRCCW